MYCALVYQVTVMNLHGKLRIKVNTKQFKRIVLRCATIRYLSLVDHNAWFGVAMI